MPQPRIFFGNTGGGGGGTIEIQKDDVTVVGSCSIINFEGSVSVTNDGGGKATITISGGGGFDVVVFRTLTNGEIAAKQLTLVTAPADPNLMLVDQKDGTPALQIGVDFTVAGAVVDWNALGLDGVIAEGDVLRFAYAS